MHNLGLRQGDPLSPMLFILAIDPWKKLSLAAQEADLLQPLHQRTTCFNIALYADDAVVFARPDWQELQPVQAILQSFRSATVMVTSLTKSEVYAIKYENHDLQDILSSFPGSTIILSLHFPWTTSAHQKTSKIGHSTFIWQVFYKSPDIEREASKQDMSLCSDKINHISTTNMPPHSFPSQGVC